VVSHAYSFPLCINEAILVNNTVMPLVSSALNHNINNATLMRQADASLLRAALAQGRAQLLTLYAAIDAQAQKIVVPQEPTLNPLLWELGHVGWFEEYWISRNRERALGALCNPDAQHDSSLLPHSDQLYDSSHIPSQARWQLPLLNTQSTIEYLNAVREKTLKLLSQTDNTDEALYFYRLVLFHEDMHREALTYMAQSLGLNLSILSTGYYKKSYITSALLYIHNTVYSQGQHNQGFSFDNELARYEVSLKAFEIDSTAVSWERFLPFVESGGYADKHFWTESGWQWRELSAQACPRYLRQQNNRWQRCEFGVWRDVNLQEAAVNLTQHEAHAWCRWAGRRLPTESEWECAATTNSSFNWGEVWEWTSSAFTPYSGFVVHPYRDYSAPWFDGRPVLRGGSSITTQRMKHPRYRNYFTAERSDVFAGFRSCAL
jgi:gamma-glutamyl hercynylcysteine S-oxide synthase